MMYSLEKSKARREALMAMERNMYLSGYSGSSEPLFQASLSLADADQRIKELEDTVAELASRVVALTADQSSSVHEDAEASNEKRIENKRRFPELAPDNNPTNDGPDSPFRFSADGSSMQPE